MISKKKPKKEISLSYNQWSRRSRNNNNNNVNSNVNNQLIYKCSIDITLYCV